MHSCLIRHAADAHDIHYILLHYSGCLWEWTFVDVPSDISVILKKPLPRSHTLVMLHFIH